MGRRSRNAARVVGVTVAVAVMAATSVGVASANALQAAEWHDCAGFYYLMADTARKIGKAEDAEMYTSMAEHASLAGMERAAADLKQALADLKAGRTADIPSSGGAGADPEVLVRRQAAKAEEQGVKPYIDSHIAKCSSPVASRIKSRASAKGK